jgi:hypothetical protein
VGGPGEMPEMQGEEGVAPQIKSEVKNWTLTDDFSFVDTVAVDTITTGFQVYHPMYKESWANVYTGNMVAPYQSMIKSQQATRNHFLFYNSLSCFFTEPEDLVFFNTRTPYTNLMYHFGGPRRRSEEAVGALFTQNVNKSWNVGVRYYLYSPVGQYEAQKSDNQNFRFFTSYKGKKYATHTVLMYARTDQYESGGILDDDYVQNQEAYGFEQTENIPVHFTTAKNTIDNYVLFFNQSLGIGSIKMKRKVSASGEEPLDTTAVEENKFLPTPLEGGRPSELLEEFQNGEEEVSLPVSTVYHTLKFENAKRLYAIDDLQNYVGEAVENPFYQNVYVDSLQTRDSVRYNSLENTFQIKFNEEANSLLKFGLRAFIKNEIRWYRMPSAPFIEAKENEEIVHYRHTDTLLISSSLGGQIFKNLGENFWWNAGLRFYFQGYRAGDTEITGEMNSQFRVLKDTAGLFADGGLYLRSPELFQNKYFSNHIQWSRDFRPEKTIRLRGGMRVPTKRLELSAEFRTITDYIYWNKEAIPDQSADIIQTVELQAKKHFQVARLHSRNSMAYQLSSHKALLPLPDFAVYSSNYYENILFKVLTFQIGFDFRYHTSYYAPAYMPATGQFYAQDERKIGNYPFFDVFLNAQLKRARVYVKYDHVNQGLMGNDYFHTIGYPANPRSLKFGLSWNFYN